MVALKIFDILIQAAHVYTVHIFTDRNRHAIVLYLSYLNTTVIHTKTKTKITIYYNLCTPTYDFPFIDIYVHCTSLLVVYYTVSVSTGE